MRSISIASLGAASSAPSCKHSCGLCAAHGPVDCGPRCVEKGGALVGRGTGGSGASLEAMLSPLARLANPAKRPQGPCEIHRLFRSMWKGVRNSDRTPPEACAQTRALEAGVGCGLGRRGTWREGAGTPPGHAATRPPRTPFLRAKRRVGNFPSDSLLPLNNGVPHPVVKGK